MFAPTSTRRLAGGAPPLAASLALASLALASPPWGCGEREVPAASAPPSAPAPAAPHRAPRRPWDAPPKLGVLLVGDETPPARRPVDLSVEADAVLRRALLGPGLFQPATTDDSTACKADLRIFYALLDNDLPNPRATAGQASVAVEGSVFCPPPDPPAGAGPTPAADGAEGVEEFRVSLADEAPFGPGPGDRSATGAQGLRLVLGRLAARVAQVLYGQVRMRHAPDEAVLAALTDPKGQPGVLAEAAGEAGERRLTAAVDDLVRLTAHPDTGVAARAGAALGLLKVRRDDVIRALAAMTRGADPERHLAAIQALGDVGGPLAARYLDTMAVGSPQPALRALARRAARRARGEDPDAFEGSAPSP